SWVPKYHLLPSEPKALARCYRSTVRRRGLAGAGQHIPRPVRGLEVLTRRGVRGRWLVERWPLRRQRALRRRHRAVPERWMHRDPLQQWAIGDRPGADRRRRRGNAQAGDLPHGTAPHGNRPCRITQGWCPTTRLGVGPISEAATSCRLTLRVEPELDDVAVGHHVVLAFDTDQPPRLRFGHRAGRHEVVEGHDLGLDEAFLEVGVNDARRLR